MIPFSQDYLCDTCGRKFNLIVEKAERFNPVACEDPDCGGLAGATIGAPTPLKASYHDGVYIPGAKQYKESLALESQMYDVHPDKRGDLKKEIDTLRSSKVK